MNTCLLMYIIYIVGPCACAPTLVYVTGDFINHHFAYFSDVPF